jgi:hypothetical protein
MVTGFVADYASELEILLPNCSIGKQNFSDGIDSRIFRWNFQ